MKSSFFLFFFLLVMFFRTFACTSYLVTKNATIDGSTLISYAGDSHVRYGQVYFKARTTLASNSVQTVYDRSSNKPLGQVVLPKETYQVIGFMNEYQVAIGESTFGGREELVDSTGIIDWGSLMFLALQRSKNARESIKVIAELVEEYGYYSSGESYSIADPNEVWIMELIGKGIDYKIDKKTKQKYNANKGAVWVAVKIPEGYISAHANQARITTFPKEDGIKSISSKNLNKIFDKNIEVVYAHDVIDFARSKKYFDGKDEEFSFSDTYAPLSFGALRGCELRVWAFFNQLNDDMQQYWEYATGDMSKPRMPLYIKPNRKVSARDLMEFKGNYLQGTELDMSKDIGAGPHAVPYRWRPMKWKYENREYFHERTTATQQTAFSWVAQMRNWLPNPIGGILWYGLDDANLSVHAPFYCGITTIPFAYAEGNGDILKYSENSAFWTFNRVSQHAYLLYDRIIVDLRKKQNELRDKYEIFVPAIDRGALLLYEKDQNQMIQFLTDFSCNTANNLVHEWKELGNFLLVKYLDGNIKNEKDGVFLRNQWGFPLDPIQPKYPDEWYRIIIDNTGEKFLAPANKQ
jgi:dipeptidase